MRYSVVMSGRVPDAGPDHTTTHALYTTPFTRPPQIEFKPTNPALARFDYNPYRTSGFIARTSITERRKRIQ